MRLFVGIPIAPATTHALQWLTARLRASEDGLRWTPPESWHITLQFLGETSNDRFACLQEALHSVKARPLTIEFESVVCFEQVGVVAVSVMLTRDLSALQRSVTQATARCGVIAEARPYASHLTLARVRRGVRLRPHGALQQAMRGDIRLPGYAAHEFLLYESHLGTGGARYEVRARFPLEESADPARE